MVAKINKKNKKKVKLQPTNKTSRRKLFEKEKERKVPASRLLLINKKKNCSE